MPLKCEAAVFTDGPAMANAYIGGFFGDPFHDALIEDVPFERQVAGVTKRWPRGYSKAPNHYRKVIDPDTGKVISYTKWGLENMEAQALFPPRTDVPDEYADFINGVATDPEGLNDPFACWFTDEAEGARAKTLGNRPMLRLMMLSTVAAAQRQGAATLQVKWGVDFADQHGLPCWTEASPHSIEILKRFGFKPQGGIVCQLSEKCGGGTYIFTNLLREPEVMTSAEA